MMTMAEAATRLGISASSLRHYEKQFDLHFARTKGGQRLLSERDLENLRIIRSFRDQNIPIEEIRQKLALADGAVETVRPELEEVVEALVARQDELERIVKAQQALLKQLTGENQQLALAQEQVQLLIAAPKEPDPLVLELAEQVAAIESHHGEELRGLQTRLATLVHEVQTLPGVPEAELEAMQSKLAELEGEIKARSSSDGADEAVATLRQKLQTLEEAIAAKSRGAEIEQVKGLQRRMLDLEAAMVIREETVPREEGLLDSLVSAIQEDARRRQPWWKFWS